LFFGVGVAGNGIVVDVAVAVVVGVASTVAIATSIVGLGGLVASGCPLAARLGAVATGGVVPQLARTGTNMSTHRIDGIRMGTPFPERRKLC
jgi:hypothetical protein